ncbi:MAG TPA: hypothetical protein DD649_12785 [Providencia sp.]|nr:hypothetical protein [Providencia sp.]
MIKPIKNNKNLIRNFKSLIFILQYIFDISFFGVGILLNVIIFLFDCYHSNKGFIQKLKQVINLRLRYRNFRLKVNSTKRKINNGFWKTITFIKGIVK